MMEQVKQLFRNIREFFLAIKDIYKKQIFVRNKKLERISLGNYFLYSRLWTYILSKNKFTIIDVGANDGWFAKIIYAFDPKANVISYEPLISHTHNLKKLAKINSGYKYYGKAVGDKKDRKMIYESSIDGLSSMKKMVDGAYGNTFDTKVVNEYEVEMITLDSEFINESNRLLIKIDVQGYEMEVLNGAKRLFEDGKVACVIIELCSTIKYENQILAPEIIGFLTKYNFQIFDLYPFYYEKTSGQLTEFDAVFINKKNCI